MLISNAVLVIGIFKISNCPIGYGAECTSGSDCVLVSRLRGCRFEPHWRHYVVSLSKTLYSLLSTGSTEEDSSQHD